MHGFRLPIAVLCCTIALSFLVVGCQGGKPEQDINAKIMRPPPKPPAYPAARRVPLDPELRDTARREIIEAARGGQVEERVHGLEAIRAANLADGIPEILDGLRDPEPVVRFAAALAAGELRVRDAQPILLDIVYDPSGSVRAAVRFALHRLGDTRFSHDLENLSQDPQPIVRSNAAMVLGLLGEKSAAKILRPMLKDPVFAVREQAAEALWRLGDEEGLEELIGLSISAHPDDQMIGLLALAEPRDQNVRQHIRGALVVVDRGGEASGYTECALVAARAMGMLGRDEGYGIALQGAASKDPRQRQLAAFAFGAIGRSDSQPILSNLLHDEDRDVRIAAAAAIFQLH